eukprot:11722292-Alexandrium_andersonii.AAC.1
MPQAGISGAAVRRGPFRAWAQGPQAPLEGCPSGGLGARPEDAAAMGRAAFPLAPDALRTLGDLVAWQRATRDAAEALGRQGRAAPRRREGPRRGRSSPANS